MFTIRDNSILGFFKDFISVVQRARAIKIDVVFDLEFFSRFTAIVSYLTGAPKRVGFYRFNYEGLYRGGLITHKIQYNPHMHMSRTYLSMAQVLKQARKLTPELDQMVDDRDIMPLQFTPSRQQRDKIISKLNQLGVNENTSIFLINPGEGNIPLREWPADRFSDIAKRILEFDSNYVVLVGTASCSIKAKKLLQLDMNNKRFIDLCGDTSTIELLTLFSISNALITNDSGLAHLASLTNIKQFILFGPESPKIFSPLGNNIKIFYSNLPCSPCLSVFNHRTSRCRDNKCMQRILSEDVYEALAGEITALQQERKLNVESVPQK